MFGREQTISQVFQSVKEEILPVNNPVPFLKMGANKESALKSCTPQLLKSRLQVEFIRKVAKAVCKASREMLEYLIAMDKKDEEFFYIIQRIMKGILTDVYKVGKCDEFTCLSLLRLLKAGMTGKIEVVAVNGFFVIDKKPIDHIFLTINRRESTDITRPESWGKFIKFDSWGEDKAIFYNGDSVPTRESLGAGALFNIGKIEVDSTWSRRLTSDDCREIVFFLELVKKQVTESLLSKAAEAAACTYLVDARQEKVAICQKIDEEIQCFRVLGEKLKLLASFRVTHYDPLEEEKAVSPTSSESSHAPENKVFRR